MHILQLTVKLNKLQSELTEEKELNKCLTTNQELYQKKLTSLEDKLNNFESDKSKEIEDLQSQLRDVMFYLDAQAKMANAGDLMTNDEIQESSIVIQQTEAESGNNNQAKIQSNSAKMASRRKRK